MAGAIFLDELDKIAPHDRVAYGDSWASSVLTDVYAFLDADTRLLSAGWSQAEIDTLSRYFICAAGTWQRHAKPGDASYADRIAGDLLIPEELAFRLNSNFIEVGLPDREDFRSAIQRIYREMEIPIPEPTRLESLIDSAVASRRGMRWIEDLVASILCANPSKIRKVEAPKIAKKRPEKNRVSVATFLEEMKSAHRMMSSLEPLAALLRAHIRSMPDKLKELGVISRREFGTPGPVIA